MQYFGTIAAAEAGEVGEREKDVEGENHEFYDAISDEVGKFFHSVSDVESSC